MKQGDVINVELWADVDDNGATPGNGTISPATGWSDYSAFGNSIYALTFDATHNVLYAGRTGSGIIYRCDTTINGGCDDASDWEEAYDTGESQIRSLFFDPEKNVIYAGSNGTTGLIARCDTDANTCIAGDGWIDYDLGGTTIYAFALDQTNNVIYASGPDVFSCDRDTGCDAAEDWTTAKDLAGYQAYTLSFDSTNKVIYAGLTAGSVYRCDTTASTCMAGDGWTSYTLGEQGVYALAFDASNNVLYAGTSNYGRIFSCDTTINGSTRQENNSLLVVLLILDPLLGSE